ncbi:MAG: serine--tRNA ligase, partial [Archaeoglobus sp.]
MWSILAALRENPEILIESQKKRGESLELVNKAIELDSVWRKKLHELNQLRHERNKMSAKIRQTKKDREVLIKHAKEISSKIKNEEEKLKKIEDELRTILLSIPNIVHNSVPVGKDDTENVPIRFWGKPKVFKDDIDVFKEQTAGFNVEFEVIDFRPLGHADTVEKFGWADVERAAKVAGSRFYYLIDDLVWLDFALIAYALDFLSKKGFSIINPPYMMRREAYKGVTA